MNINKKLLLIIFALFIFSNLSILKADEEKINLDDEELPAIDPFQGNSSASSGQNEQASDNSNTGGGLLNGMRLVGTIIGKNKKIAILSSPGGSAFKYEENDEIANGTILIEVFNEYLIVEDENNQLFQVYMNNVEKMIEG
tara:strand:- start:2265 stop:2687 length:423 start_codon:yes stop_codon:yes gene_type:complete